MRNQLVRHSKSRFYVNCLKLIQAFSVLSVLFLSFELHAFLPDEDLGPVPEEHNLWLSSLIVPDDAGVMNSMKATYTSWVELEEYIDNWNLESTNIYRLPTEDEKKSYTSKMLLKYVDKRISGEVRRSKEGSTLYAIGKAQKALRPQSEVRFAPNFKIKFKARVIQRRAFVIVKNPFMDYQATINHRGHVLMTMTRNIESLGVFASLNYVTNEDYWIASFDRRLTSKISSRLSSRQSDKEMAFTREADTRVELFFNHYF